MCREHFQYNVQEATWHKTRVLTENIIYTRHNAENIALQTFIMMGPSSTNLTNQKYLIGKSTHNWKF